MSRTPANADRELVALNKVTSILQQVESPDARCRIIDYCSSRFETIPPEAKGQASDPVPPTA